MSLDDAWVLHQRISPDRWCVTRSEFEAFVDVVQRRWAEGEIPNSQAWPNPVHEDAEQGPDLYQVNEHVVKPMTLKAGGMSYALMVHPSGLPCQVFISHSWKEGIFHLRSSIRSAWPQFQGLRNLYCCLLANPQNLDINALLGGDLSESPFAKALEKASHLLVVPNPTVGVYSRLWCVYEAYLGVQMHKTYLLPVKPRGKVVLKTVAWNMWPALCGIISGIPFMLLFDWADKKYTRAGYVVCFFYWLFSATAQASILMADDRSQRLKWIFRFLQCMTCLGWGISMPWLRWCDTQAQHRLWVLVLMALLHYGGPLNMTITNSVIVYFFSHQQAEDAESKRQEAMVQFQSVRSAHCSCPHDEQRIRLAIEGAEEEVDKVIGILVKAGAYTDQLREAWEMGKNLQGAGYTSLLSSSMVAMLGWTFVAADSVSGALLVQRMELSIWWLRDGFLVLAAVCCITVGAVFTSMLWANCHGPDRAVFVVRSWATCAIWTLLLPLLTSLFFQYDEALLSPLRNYVDWSNLEYISPPSENVVLAIFVPRVLLLVGAWISAFTDPLGWRRPWMKGLRKRVHTYYSHGAPGTSSAASATSASASPSASERSCSSSSEE